MTTDKVVTAENLLLAAAGVDLGNLTGTVNLNLATFLGLAYGTMTGNVTLGTFTNNKQGQTFTIELKQDATGGRTLSLTSPFWVTVGGVALDISTAANALNVLICTVLHDGRILVGAGKAVA